VFNVERQEIEFREIRYVPGLYKIFGKCAPTKFKLSFLTQTKYW
jgi:hypothetical protein